MPKFFAIIAILLAMVNPAHARQPLNDMKPPEFSANPPVEATKDKRNSITYALGLSALDKGYFGNAAAYGEAMKNFEATCKLGIGVGCYGVGLLYAQGKGVAVDTAMAAKQFRAACDLAIPEGCNMLGQASFYGNGVAKDASAAASHFASACNNKRAVAEACTWLATLNSVGIGVAKNVNTAFALFQKGCQGGDAVGCAGAGQAYKTGQGVKQDYARAAKLFDQGCTRLDRSGAACYGLGQLTEEGQGVKKDLAAAVNAYERGCESGPKADVYPQGCYLAARAYYDGRVSSTDGKPTEQSLKTAFFLMRTGCRHNHADSCAGAGLMFYNGQAFESDGTRLAKNRANAVELERVALRHDPDNELAKKILTQLGEKF